MRLAAVSQAGCVLALAVVLASRALPRVDHSLAPAAAERLLGAIPAAFVPNLGQWQHPARFVARVGPVTAFLEERGFRLALGGQRGAALRMTFADASAAELRGERLQPGHHNYLLGPDPTRWRSDVPLYGAVRYRGLYPGVDVVCYEKAQGLEYDVALMPGADLARVEVAVDGARLLRIDGDGALVVETAAGVLRQSRPTTYELDTAGGRRELTARYELRGADRFGIAVACWSGERALVVDPGLSWSTFAGGSEDDVAVALAVDATGIVTITGHTTSADYPTTTGAFAASLNGASDVFVTSLEPSRSERSQLRYSTFVGGPLPDRAFAISVDAAGIVTIAGVCGPGYPTTAGAWDTMFSGALDAFLTRLDPSQSGAQQFVYSTYVGGELEDRARAMWVDAAGVITIAGDTTSPNFPTTPGAFDATFNGGNNDVFVARLDPSLPARQQLLYGTYVGGTDDDSVNALAAGAEGVVTIAGRTASLDWPTSAGAWNPTHNGGATDAFLTRLDPSRLGALQLVYSTFAGGEGGDEAFALAQNTAGVATIAGATGSPGFPTTPGAWDPTHNGARDVFVSSFDPSQSAAQQLVYSTFIGGAAADSALALSVDVAGVVRVAGTAGPGYPTTAGAWDTTFNGGNGDAFVTLLDPSRPAAQQLIYSTFIGGANADSANALWVDAAGIATIAADTSSFNYPTTPSSFDRTFNGNFDAVVTRLDLLPTGVVAFGRPSPWCGGPPAISVNAMPRVGNGAFSLSCTGAPPTASGAVALGALPLAAPLGLLGVELWVDPAGAWFLLFPAQSNPRGAADFPIPIPPNPVLAGQQLHGQFLWLGPSSPPPCPPLGLAASSALEITIQP